MNERPSSAPKLVALVAASPSVCRCGTRLSPGTSCLVVEQLPPRVLPMFQDLGFCSVGCVRAHFLESLSILEGMEGPASEAVVSDLRLVYRDLTVSFAQLLAAQARIGAAGE